MIIRTQLLMGSIVSSEKIELGQISMGVDAMATPVISYVLPPLATDRMRYSPFTLPALLGQLLFFSL